MLPHFEVCSFEVAVQAAQQKSDFVFLHLFTSQVENLALCCTTLCSLQFSSCFWLIALALLVALILHVAVMEITRKGIKNIVMFWCRKRLKTSAPPHFLLASAVFNLLLTVLSGAHNRSTMQYILSLSWDCYTYMFSLIARRFISLYSLPMPAKANVTLR